MTPAAACILLALAFGSEALAQLTLGFPSTQTPASPGWPFGPPRNVVSFEGLLERSDGETLSIEWRDHLVIRFQLDERTEYKAERPPDKLTTFHVADIVAVKSEVESKGYLLARMVRFVRKATPDEQADVLQSPEAELRWRVNVLGGNNLDPARDDRRLSQVAKPAPISDRMDYAFRPQQDQASSDTIAIVRRRVNDAFLRLPNFRARQVTSLFRSNSKPVRWVPDSLISAEVAYDDDRESYSDLRIDGKRPADAPATGDAEYMHSLDKAWSTGDFETISHCVLSELQDSDFRRVRIEHGGAGDLAVFEFTGRRASACIAVRYRSQVAYPAYRGLLKVRAQTGEVMHVELEATEMPNAFAIDRAERSVDFDNVRIGGEQYQVPTTAYWFGCFRNSYSCFLNRVDFRDYRRFESDSTIRFDQ